VTDATELHEEAVTALRRIAFLLERAQATSYRPEAFRRAARTVEETDAAQVLHLVGEDRLRDLPGVGEKTAAVVSAVVRGREVAYLAQLEREAADETPWDPAALDLRRALRGDLHAHSEASDGATPIQEMVLAALELRHEYLTITDHSPRLTVANGLSAPRLRAQLAEIAALNRAVAPFRVLTGIEVDILEDGALDQDPRLLAELDIVVASVHSKLRMDRPAMTRRMLRAVGNPVVTVLGHCTGRRIIGSRPRPPSEFDPDAVFAACAENGVAVEINCRPDRLDPPHELLQVAVDAGCLFSIDTDAHAPGQLDWQRAGCERAVAHGITADRVINARSADAVGRRGAA
jgi:putative hydrolase